MSMISAQCDELRSYADRADGTFPMLASALRDAADTIWELRESVHRERAEADKLREERDMYRDLVGMMDHPDLNAQLQAENAKLRELCKDMMAFVEDDDACERCGHDVECVEAADGELVLPYEGQCLMLDLFADRMRELGVEVDS